MSLNLFSTGSEWSFASPSKLFVGCLASRAAIQANSSLLLSQLERAIGPIEEVWPTEEGWVAPNSYARELGEQLTTLIIVFEGFWRSESLAWVKRRTLEVEEAFTPVHNRQFNLNPGVLDEVSLRLASHKPSPRRRQIGEQVWAEDQMYWVGKNLVPCNYAFQEYLMGDRLLQLRQLGEDFITRSPSPSQIITVETVRAPVFSEMPERLLLHLSPAPATP